MTRLPCVRTRPRPSSLRSPRMPQPSWHYRQSGLPWRSPPLSSVQSYYILNFAALQNIESPELEASKPHFIIYSSFLFRRQLNFHCRAEHYLAWQPTVGQTSAKRRPHLILFCLPSKAPCLGKLERWQNFCKSHFRLNEENEWYCGGVQY